MNTPRLQKLLDKQNQIKAQIDKEKSKLRSQQRKDDTRRKIIVGSLALEHLLTRENNEASHTLAKLIDQFTTRPGDRTLLGLPDEPVKDPAQIIEHIKAAMES